MNDLIEDARKNLYVHTKEYNEAVDTREELNRRMLEEIPEQYHTFVLEYALATVDMYYATDAQIDSEKELKVLTDRAKMPFWKKLFQL